VGRQERLHLGRQKFVDLLRREADEARGVHLGVFTLASGLINRAAIEEMIAAHTSRRADHGDRLWALIMLELWLRAFKM
jgi:hypothetical protein